MNEVQQIKKQKIMKLNEVIEVLSNLEGCKVYLSLNSGKEISFVYDESFGGECGSCIVFEDENGCSHFVPASSIEYIHL